MQEGGARSTLRRSTSRPRMPRAISLRPQSQEGGNEGHVRRLASHRLRRSPVLVHLGTIGDHSDEAGPAVACPASCVSSIGSDRGRRHPGQDLATSAPLRFAWPQSGEHRSQQLEGMPGLRDRQEIARRAVPSVVAGNESHPAVEDLNGGFPRVLMVVRTDASL